MKPLEIGKLYCVRENPIQLLSYKRFVMGWIDTSVPFLLLKVEGRYCQVLFEDKTGWIDIDINPDNPVVEFNCA